MKDVRLSEREWNGIIQAAKAVLGASLSKIVLFGSRVDLKKAGGDIDLAFEVFDGPLDKHNALRLLRIDLCARLGEQKFDLLIISDNPSANSERETTFYGIVKPESKIIWSVHE